MNPFDPYIKWAGEDPVENVMHPVGHTASRAGRGAVTGAGIGTGVGLAMGLMSKGHLGKGVRATGIGGMVGGTLGAVSGGYQAGQERQMTMAQMGLTPTKFAALHAAAEAGRFFALQKTAGLSLDQLVSYCENFGKSHGSP